MKIVMTATRGIKTLWDAFCDAPSDGRRWQIHENGTKKLLCKDYGSLPCGGPADIDGLDDRIFVKAELKKGKFDIEYWQVFVE